MRKLTVNFRGEKKIFVREPKAGDDVFLCSDRFPIVTGSSMGNPVVGSNHECSGKIAAANDQDPGVVVVKWNNGRNNTYRITDLVLVSEFIENFPPFAEEDLLPVNDIVYIKYTKDIEAHSGWPMVGTPHEIDCKILKADRSPLGFRRSYELISGNGSRIFTDQSDLLSIKEREEFLMGGLHEYVALEDMHPLYNKGQRFKHTGEYLVSLDESVSLNYSKAIKNFELCSTSDKQ